MQASWVIIAILNCAWGAFLWRRRKHDHPWLFWFFFLYTATDIAMMFCDSPKTGGFNLINQATVGRELWIGVVCLLWSSWFLALFYSIVKLYYRRISPIWFYLPALIVVLLSFSESFGLSTVVRRIIMHIVLEPILLIVTLAIAGKYIVRQVSNGEELDFLGVTIILTSFMFTIRLLLMMDKSLMLSRLQSHVLFYFYMMVIIFSYFALPRFRRWMLFH